MQITDEQKKVLREYIGNLEQIIDNGDINDLLLEIDEAMTNCLDENGEIDNTGARLSKIYDEIFINN